VIHKGNVTLVARGTLNSRLKIDCSKLLHKLLHKGAQEPPETPEN